MSNQQVSINLAFTADTKQAVQQLQSLRQQLDVLHKGVNLKTGNFTSITPEIQKATQAAGELQVILNNAINVKTGKLDLTKFTNSLKSSKTDLSYYAKELNKLGPTGQKAFLNLAQSIVKAEEPLVKANGLLKQFGTTMMNTVKWQLSSSLVHGFMSGLQKAFGYAQDLNRSLNDIRIVTGNSSEEMAKFAKSANAAAKQLSTTTTDYTKASLIYFQQGLSDAEVKKRTDTTIKMANVTRQSVEEVSDQMTAVWNNFAKHGEDLERFADVMTALGAATASSSDEIAGGLEKFAALADTIGLSFDYAASALATITANTRQSEDVVGTALKTIFARIQGLKLGETLEDGTSLNKYSQALKTVGIDILNQSGELKNMDTILDEIGAKWQTLSKAQQSALAQTIAGTRQYTQLVALMNNWEDMQTNLDISSMADGTLANQADIYEESWAAASKRVKASFEGVWDSVINDEFFIKLTDGFAKLIEGLEGFIDGMGGLKGVLTTVGMIAMTVFRKEIAGGLTNAANSLRSLTAAGAAERAQTRTDAVEAIGNLKSSNQGKQGEAETSQMQRLAQMQQKLLENNKNLTEEEKLQLQNEIDKINKMGEHLIALGKIVDKEEQKTKYLKEQSALLAKMKGQQEVEKDSKFFAKKGQEYIEQAVNGTLPSESSTAVLNAATQAEKKVMDKYGLRDRGQIAKDSSYEQEMFEETARILREMDSEISQTLRQEIDNFKQESGERRQEEQKSRNEKVEQAGKVAGAGEALDHSVNELSTQLKPSSNSKQVLNIADQLKSKIAAAKQEAEKLDAALGGDSTQDIKDQIAEFDKLEKKIEEAGGDADKLREILDSFSRTSYGDTLTDKAQEALGITADNQEDLNIFDSAKEEEKQRSQYRAFEGSLDSMHGKFNQDVSTKSQKIDGWANSITSAAFTISSLGATINSVQGIIDTFNNPDATGWQKFSAVLGALTPILTMGASAARAVSKEMELMTAAKAKDTTVTDVNTVSAIRNLIVKNKYILIAAAVAAAIGGIIFALVRASQAEEREAQRAAESAKKLKEQAEQAKNEVSSIADAIKEYTSVADTLENCTKGTQEWFLALENVHKQVDSLLEEFPDLLKYADLFNEDGTINIERLQQWQDEKEDIAINAQNTALMGQYNAHQEKLDIKYDNIDSYEYSDIYKDFSALPQYTEYYIQKILQEEATNLAEVQGLFPELTEKYCEAVLEIANSEREGINILKNANKQIVNNWEEINGITLTDQQSALMGQAYNNTYQGLLGKLESNANTEKSWKKELRKLDLDIDESSEYAGLTMLEAYNKATGVDYNWKKNDVYQNNELVYLDEEGDKQRIDEDTIRQTVANAITMESLGLEDIAKVSAQISELNTIAGGDNVFGSFIGGQGSLTSLTSEELNAFDLDEYLSQAGITDIENFAKSLGFETEEAFKKAIDSAKTYADEANIFDAEEELKYNISEFQNTFALINSQFKDILKNSSIEVQNQVVNSLDEAFSLGGEELANTLASALGPALETLDSTELGELMSLLANFDWSQEGAMDSFLDQLYEISPALADSESGFLEFAENAANAGKNLPIEDMKTFIGQLRELLGLLNDLEIGKIISPEEFNKLKGYMPNAEDYFAQDLEGNYVMTREISPEQAMANAENRFKNLNNAYDQIEERYKNETNLSNLQRWSNEDIETFTNTKGRVDGATDILRGRIDSFDDNALLTIFGDSRDALLEILNSGTASQIQDLLKEYTAFMQEGMTGAFDESNLQAIRMQAATDAQTLSQQEGYYDISGNISEDGIVNLSRIAAGSEETQWALDKYNNAIANTTEGTEEWHAANKQLEKDLKNIQNTKAAKTISSLAKDLDKLTGTEREQKLSNIANEFKNAFGLEDVSTDWVEENLGVIDDWANGATQEIRDAAQKKLLDSLNLNNIQDSFNSFIENLNNSEFDWSITGFEDLEEKIDNIRTMVNKPFIAECVMSGNFSGLINQLAESQMSAEELAILLSQISGAKLDANGFKEMAAAFRGYKEALLAGDEDRAEVYAGILDDMTPTITFGDSFGQNTGVGTSSGGGGGGKDETSITEKRKAALEKERSDLQKKREGKYASAAAEYYDKEIELLKEENAILEKQLILKKDILKNAISEFQQKYPEFDIQLNDDGTIAGLSKILAQLEAEALKIEAEGGDASAIYEKMEAMEEMLEANEDIANSLEEIEDNTQAMAEATLNKITEQIDEQVDAIDKKIDVANYYQEKLLNLAWGNKQEIEAMLEGFQYQVEEMNLLFEKSNVLIDGIEQLDKASKSFPDQAKMFNDAIEGYQDDLMDATEAMIDLRVEIEELIGSVLDLAQAEIDIQLGRIDTYISILDSYNNIIDLSGRSTIDFANKTRIGAMKVDFYASKMNVLKTEMESLRVATEQAKQSLEDRRNANDEQSIKFWEYQVEELKKKAEEASAEFLASWEEALTAASELYEARVEMAIAVMEDALSPYKTMEELQAVYDRAKEIQERYLSDSKKLYELNKMNRQLNLAIGDENDLLAKSKLRDLQEEIYEFQRQGVNMNQHDLDIMQKKYDLRLAEIALMEAENSKTRMRLVRDASGNYSYVYDADEQKIEDATQTYEDAVYALQEVAEQYVTEVSDQLLENQTAYQEAIMNLDKTATDYDEQLLDTTQYYVERQKYLLDELQKAANESGINFADTLYASQMGVLDYVDAYDLFETASNNMIDELSDSHKEFSDLVDDTMEMAGTSWENFGEDTDVALTTLEEHVAKLCDEIENLVDVLMKYVNQSISMVTAWQKEYSAAWTQQIGQNEAIFQKDYSKDDKINQLSQAKKNTSSTASSTYNPSKTTTTIPQGGSLNPPGASQNVYSYDENGRVIAVNGVLTDYGKNNGYTPYYQDTYIPPGSFNVISDPNVVNQQSVSDAYNVKSNGCAAFARNCQEAYGNTVGGSHAYTLDNSNAGYYWQPGDGNLPAGAIIQSGNHCMVVGDNGKLYGTDGNNYGIEKIDVSEIFTEGFPGASSVYVIPATINGKSVGNLAAHVYATKTGDWSDYLGFNTGGYTGDWLSSEGLQGNGGKLAILHQKEIVLNKDDTQNLLDTVKMIRGESISDFIDKQVASMVSMTNDTLTRLIHQVNIEDSNRQPIEQTVQINAEFPNVTDKYEIQEALENLSNSASQYLGLNKF